MKKLLLIFTLLFSTLMFSTPSYGEWTRTGRSDMNGGNFYVDFERIRKHDGYVYFWQLRNFVNPDEYGFLSAKSYYQGDCKVFRTKMLSASLHKKPMGKGDFTTLLDGGYGEEQNWQYSHPGSNMDIMLQKVCSQ
jgi:hypothetical protein